MRRLFLSLIVMLLGCASTTQQVDYSPYINTLILYDTEGRVHVLELDNSPMVAGKSEMLLFCRVHEFPEMIIIGIDKEIK